MIKENWIAIYIRTGCCLLFGYQAIDNTNVTLVFEDAQFLPSFSREEKYLGQINDISGIYLGHIWDISGTYIWELSET